MKSLSLGQVAVIQLRDVINKSAVGGPDMSILVVAEMSGGGVRSPVVSDVFGGSTNAVELREVRNATQVPTILTSSAPAFGTAGFEAADAAGASVVETEASISQRLFLVTMGALDGPEVRVFEAARAAGS